MISSCTRNASPKRRLLFYLSLAALTASTLSLGSATAKGQNDTGPIVAVTGGKVQGRPLPAPGGAVFKGIPYAAQPIGDLRWKETQPLKPWTGVLEAAEFRNGCGLVPKGADAAKLNTEDCLYLNVWAPEWPSKTKKAVMVWLTGGELFGGSGALAPGSESLARHGVILVGVNYRGGPLGMMGHPELTAESPHHSSANYMIYDIVAALKWIHENIAQFGGDPGNVTVFGQSGGARMTSFLITSPLAKGLIHRAIIESAGPVDSTRPDPRLDQMEQIGIAMADVLHAPAKDQIRYLRSLPAPQIMDAMRDARRQMLPKNHLAYDEGADGYAIPLALAEVFRSHQEFAIPVMIGSNAQDTGAAIIDDPVPPQDMPMDQYRTWAKNVLAIFYANYPDLLRKAEQNYGLNGSPNEVVADPVYGPPMLQLGGDLNHRCGVRTAAAWHSSIAPTYAYEFSISTPEHLPLHSAELRYIFGRLSSDEMKDESARKRVEQIQEYWTNFAKTGNPNGPGLPEWSKFSAGKKQSMEFTNDGPVERTGSRAVACEPYIEKMTRDPKPLFGDGENLRVRAYEKAP